MWSGCSVVVVSVKGGGDGEGGVDGCAVCVSVGMDVIVGWERF